MARLYYYEDVPNFGDRLNQSFWPHFLGGALAAGDDALLLGIGTIIKPTIRHTGRVIVMGSGCGYEAGFDVTQRPNWICSFVRGPLTARLLHLDGDAFVTDPAMLVSDMFPAVRKRHGVAFVPHWETSLSPLWRLACARAGLTYVDPLAPVEAVVAAIAGSELVLCEAMHGAIVADSMRTPWIPVSTSARVNGFKWMDWTLSLGIEMPRMERLPVHSPADFFRTVMTDPWLEKGLRSAVGELPGAPAEPAGSWLQPLRAAYAGLIPRPLRYRLEHRLIQKIGPAMDARLARAWPRALASAGASLRRAAGQHPALSPDHVLRDRKERLLGKMEEISDLLLASETPRHSLEVVRMA